MSVIIQIVEQILKADAIGSRIDGIVMSFDVYHNFMENDAVSKYPEIFSMAIRQDGKLAWNEVRFYVNGSADFIQFFVNV
jgi:hypothetical protein